MTNGTRLLIDTYKTLSSIPLLQNEIDHIVGENTTDALKELCLAGVADWKGNGFVLREVVDQSELISRCLYILTLLTPATSVTAGDIAKELGVCERTVFRLVKTLNDAGIKLEGDKNGYTITPDLQQSLRGLMGL